MDNLPEEWKIEILVHLPVKSLLRLKCVSKSWFSLISNPNFAKLHFQRSSQKQRTHRFLYTTASEIRSIDLINYASLHDDFASVKLHFPLRQPLTHFRILGSCRGLLLLLLTKEQLLLSWNPSTGFCKQIPHPRLSWKLVVPYSFCYDESTDDYFLLLALCYSGSITGYEVFSLRTNSCEKLPLNYDHRRTSVLRLPRCSVLNGVFHLLVSNPKPPHEEKLVAFNITTKSFRELPMPSDDIYPLRCCNLGVLEGCLTLIDSKAIDEVKVWVMRQEHGEKSLYWTELFSVSHHEDSNFFYSPLCFNKEGELVAQDCHLGLSKWNDKGELLEYRKYFDPHDYWRPTTLYTETLLSFP